MSINKPSDLSNTKLWAAVNAALSAGTISGGTISGGTLAGDLNAITIIPDQSGNNEHLTTSGSPYLTAIDGALVADENSVCALAPYGAITLQNNSFTIGFVGKTNSFLNQYGMTASNRAIQFSGPDGIPGSGGTQYDGELAFYDGTSTIRFFNGSICAMVPTTRTSWFISGNTSNCVACIDGVTYNAASTFGNGSSTWNINTLLGYFSTNTNYEVTDIIIRTVPSSAADLAALTAWAQINRGAGAPRNAAEPVFQGKLCIPGASITAGHLVTSRYRYASQLQIPATIQISTPCQTSRTTANFLAEINSTTAPYVKAGLFNIALVAESAVNDLLVGGLTGAQAYNNSMSLVTRLRAEGYNKIGVMTLPGFGASSTGTLPTAIAAYNALIYAAKAAGLIDGIADLASDPNMGPAGSGANSLYFNASDHLHWTPLGHTIAAMYVSNFVNALIGAATTFSGTSLIFGSTTPLPANKVLSGTNYNVGGSTFAGIASPGPTSTPTSTGNTLRSGSSVATSTGNSLAAGSQVSISTGVAMVS